MRGAPGTDGSSVGVRVRSKRALEYNNKLDARESVCVRRCVPDWDCGE